MAGFDRTYEELKLLTGWIEDALGRVLIVPMRN